MRTRRHAVAVLAVASLLPVAVLTQAAGATADDDQPAATPRAAERYQATITRTAHGIPHVVADDWGSLGFGHGYATAETNLCNLADTLVTGRGERSRWFGPDERYEDQVTLSATNLRDRRAVHRHPQPARWSRTCSPTPSGARAARRASFGAWLRRRREQVPLRDLGGPDKVPRPDLPRTRLHQAERDRGSTSGTASTPPTCSPRPACSCRRSSTPPRRPRPGDGLPESGGFARRAADQLPAAGERARRPGQGPPAPFGSNATAVGGDATTTGRGMILGNPHFPWRGRYRFDQVQLTIPGKYDVAGASLIGSPVVNIGWNSDVAWSHTVRTAYRFTPYEYRTCRHPTTYLTDSGPKELDHRIVSIKVQEGRRLARHGHRGPLPHGQGYVLATSSVLMAWSR